MVAVAQLTKEQEKLLLYITKNGKSGNLESLLNGSEDPKPLVNTNFDGLRPIHIIAIRSRDQDLERKLRLVLKFGADVYQTGGGEGLTGAFFGSLPVISSKCSWALPVLPTEPDARVENFERFGRRSQF